MLPVFFDVPDVAGDDVGDVGKEREVDAGFAVRDFGEELPDLICGEAEDGRDEAGEGFGDTPESGLRAATAGVVGGEGVEAVFEDVEVERAEVGVYVLVECLIGAVELEVVVGFADLCVELGGAGEDELVEGLHLREVDGVGGGVEVVEVAEEEAQGVAQLAVVVADALHDVFAGDDILAEVDGGDPETDDLAAETLGDVDRINAVADGLRQGRAVLFEGPADCSGHSIWCVTTEADRVEKRGLEPAAVLITALGIEIGGGGEFGLVLEDGMPACAGFEPDVEDVHLFAELFVAA